MRTVKDGNIRLCTNRDYASGWEAIEQQPNGVLAWLAEENNIFAYFPCDADFASDVFAKCGRSLDVGKLPRTYRSAFDWVQ